MSTSISSKIGGKTFNNLQDLFNYVNTVNATGVVGQPIFINNNNIPDFYIKYKYYVELPLPSVWVNDDVFLNLVSKDFQFQSGIVLGFIESKDDVTKVPYNGATSDLDLKTWDVFASNFNLYGLDTENQEVIVPIRFDQDTQTLTFDLQNGISGNVNQELWMNVKSRDSYVDGQIAQFVGTTGANILVKNGNLTELNENPEFFVGVYTSSGNANEFTKVTFFGEVKSIDTRFWVAENQPLPILYLATDPSNPGYLGMTTIQPPVGYRRLRVAAISHFSTGSASNGIIFVRPTFSNKLTDLTDINDGASNSGDILVYDAVNNYFSFTANINDYALSSSLSSEASTRTSADASLSTGISSVSTALSTGLSQRISTDISLSTELSSKISTEILNRASADTSLSTALSTTTAIAKGAQQGITFNSYFELVQFFNQTGLENIYNIGQSVYIATIDVPDLWISSGSYYLSYTYTNDDDLIAQLSSGVHIGNYIFKELETEKVDLTSYVLSSDLSSEISNRISADESLSNALSGGGGAALSTEISDRISADESLYTIISTEISDRVSADLSLSTAIGTGGGASALVDLTDVSITTPTDGALLQYDAATSMWINYAASNFVKNNTDTYTSTASIRQIITLTQSEYDAISSKDAYTMYIISL